MEPLSPRGTGTEHRGLPLLAHRDGGSGKAEAHSRGHGLAALTQTDPGVALLESRLHSLHRETFVFTALSTLFPRRSVTRTFARTAESKTLDDEHP